MESALMISPIRQPLLSRESPMVEANDSLIEVFEVQKLEPGVFNLEGEDHFDITTHEGGYFFVEVPIGLEENGVGLTGYAMSEKQHFILVQLKSNVKCNIPQ